MTTTYRYRALRPDGGTVTGTVMADCEQDVLSTLSHQALFPVGIQAIRPFVGHRRSLPAIELALGLRLLSNLLESGLPVGRSIAALTELAPPSWAKGIGPIREAVRNGKSLTAAFASSPLDIPPIVLGILRAGEMGGDLGPAVGRAAELMERVAATRAAIRNALAYPMVLAVAGSISLALLIGVVLPKFTEILADLGQELPHTTRVVLGIAATVRASAIPALVGLSVLAVAWRVWTQSAHGRLVWHRLRLALPVIGSVRRSGAASRTAAAMASLLESGVPVAGALIHAAAASGDAALERRLLEAREHIVRGERTSRAVEMTGALTPTAVRLLRAGEETGRLAQMFSHVASIERERAEHAVRNAVRLLEPTLILAFGLVVAFVAAALLQAVYSVRPAP